MATIVQTVPYGMFVEKIECANHACKGYGGPLEELVKKHSEYRGKGGRLTKRVIQRLTVGAWIAIRMHSETGNVQQLRHDLRNGPAHVFGDHRKCNPHFCRHSAAEENASEINETDDSSGTTAFTFHDQVEAIIMDEENTAAEPSADEEADARRGSTGQLSTLSEGLFARVMACGDRLVMLAPRLITNQTSNLAEYYMSIRCYFDGGKQFNRIQCGSFEDRCYAAVLRVQNGPKWTAEFWEKTAGEKPGQVFQAQVNLQQKRLEYDRKRKSSSPYKKRKAARYTTTSSTVQHHYGPQCQQPDLPREELLTLCQEYYDREVATTEEKAASVQ